MKNILVVNTAYLGDVILTSLLTQEIKKLYPNSHLIFMVNTPYAEAAEHLEGVNEVIEFDKEKYKKLTGWFAFVRNFPYGGSNKPKIDAAFIVNKNQRNIILAWLLGSKKIISRSLNIFNLFLTHKYRRNFDQEKVAISYANLLSTLTGEKTSQGDVKFNVPETSQELMDKKLGELGIINKEIVAINPLSKSKKKDWDIQETTELAKLLINLGKIVVITGNKRSEIYGKHIIKTLGANSVFDFTGKTTISELGALYKRCKTVVSVDTGAMHLACAVNTPTVALFYINWMQKWAPLNLSRNRVIYKSDKINANDVLEVAKELWV